MKARLLSILAKQCKTFQFVFQTPENVAKNIAFNPSDQSSAFLMESRRLNPGEEITRKVNQGRKQIIKVFQHFLISCIDIKDQQKVIANAKHSLLKCQFSSREIFLFIILPVLISSNHLIKFFSLSLQMLLVIILVFILCWSPRFTLLVKSTYLPEKYLESTY